MMKPSAIAYPAECQSVGKKMEYISKVLVPAKRYEEYLALMEQVLADEVHYIDPVHELKGKEAVLAMLKKYVPRASNEKFKFELLVDSESALVWKWTIALKIRFSPFEFTINGLVHAQASHGKIFYQREYYDPMESIGVIPVFGHLYKLILKMG